MFKKFREFADNESGATAIEYGLIAALPGDFHSGSGNAGQVGDRADCLGWRSVRIPKILSEFYSNKKLSN